MAVLEGLKPEKVFYYFEQLCSVPHGSGNTKIISDLLVDFAKEQGLRYRQDDLNNVVIYKDAAPGYENSPVYIVQGHMDMVCAQTPDCTKDMAKEGLDLMTDGEWVWADKTSLGGDDCIAVACAMAMLADKELKAPALEVVITVDEETGMDGASGLDCSDLKGRRLLNLDSEEEGVFTLSCAGGCRTDGFIPAKLCDIPEDYLLAKIVCTGFLGGHSGCDIADGRGSANYLMGQFLYFASTHNQGMLLVSGEGGKFDNVICNHSEVVIAAPSDAINPINSMCLRYREKIKEELATADPNAEIKFELMGKPEAGMQAYNLAKTQKILAAWSKMPHGIKKMLPDFEGIPQTSLNMGVMKVDSEGFFFKFAVRSSIKAEKDELVDEIVSITKAAGGDVQLHGIYPAWPYRKESEFRDLSVKVYKELNGVEPGRAATHGGLECGLFIDKIPGLDAISLGPALYDIHSPRERLSVPSTERMYQFVCKLLEESK